MWSENCVRVGKVLSEIFQELFGHHACKVDHASEVDDRRYAFTMTHLLEYQLLQQIPC